MATKPEPGKQPMFGAPGSAGQSPWGGSPYGSQPTSPFGPPAPSASSLSSASRPPTTRPNPPKPGGASFLDEWLAKRQTSTPFSAPSTFGQTLPKSPVPPSQQLWANDESRQGDTDSDTMLKIDNKTNDLDDEVPPSEPQKTESSAELAKVPSSQPAEETKPTSAPDATTGPVRSDSTIQDDNIFIDDEGMIHAQDKAA